MKLHLTGAGLALCLVLALTACGGGGDTFINTSSAPPKVTVGDFENADLVLGQGDFVSGTANRGGAIAANALATPGQPSLGLRYIPDAANNRVVGYTTQPGGIGEAADFVLGQADFASGTAGLSATEMSTPLACCVNGSRLFVSDFTNRRVLMYTSLPTTTNAAANRVIGQADFASDAAAVTASGLSGPVGVFSVGTRLIVADTSANRVLIWNSLPTGNGQAADLVLGQADFVSGTANRGGAIAANTLDTPSYVWSDGRRLVVADGGNHRVLIWQTFPTTNGQAADIVLGQPDMTTGTANNGGLSDSSLFTPSGVYGNATQLFIGDTLNHRILVFETFPTVNNESADKVLGQSDFAHNTANDDDQDGASDATPSARTLAGNLITGLPITADARRLYVADSTNHRILVWQP